MELLLISLFVMYLGYHILDIIGFMLAVCGILLTMALAETDLFKKITDWVIGK